jgi:effector-binding domain-containing protein
MPTIEQRAEQAYVAIVGDVTMATIPAIADRMPEVFGWLAGKGVAPAGPPFFKYDVIDMARGLRIEVGVPLRDPIPGEGDVVAGVLPAGRYATVSHVGHPRELEGVTGDLLAWAEGDGLTFDVQRRADGEHWGARLEYYLTDPRLEPDMSKWEVVLAFRLA